MEDSHLNSLRREPSPAFAARLQSSLREQDTARSRAPWPRLRTIAAPAVVVAVIGGLLSVPSVRASAQSFLALFRVVNFVAVPVDESRIAVLESENLDPPRLIGEQIQVLEDPGPPIGVVSPEQAGAAAGITVKVPTYEPTGAVRTAIEVKGQQRMRATGDANRLRQIMDTLAINDLEVPEGLDGQVVDVRIPPVVVMRYERGDRPVVEFLQAQSPEVVLPDGINLPAFGEIGLRILGLSPIEARDFAQSIDWHTTLLLPIPAAATSFKQITINGYPAVAIERVRRTPEGGRSVTNSYLWSRDGEVFGMNGALSTVDMLKMAESLK
ncbi:MAG TPA: hypothetical protein VFB92_04570 [Vicinamibacterales bacterium]|nr:hypothetical protein [Vicinamibacterales bacterium]